MKHTIIAVIGTAEGSTEELKAAEELGNLIAKKGWTLITGGLGGVMEAASRGASKAGGTVVGIIPQGETKAANPYVHIPIATNMGHARNPIIVHSADAIVAVGGGYGTLSEIAIALKLGKPLFTIGSWDIKGTKPVKDAQAAIKACEASLGEHV
jgi:uncharacterized protein (TIGR00725 family)